MLCSAPHTGLDQGENVEAHPERDLESKEETFRVREIERTRQTGQKKNSGREI